MPTFVYEPESFQHMLRVQNTNCDGKQKVPFAIRKIRGIGRRFAFMICRKAEIDVNRRAGTLDEEERERLVRVMQNPASFHIPVWFLNRQKDPVTGLTGHDISNQLDTTLRQDLERMKKMRMHRGLRHSWGLRVRGQHTKTTGRRGKTVGIAKTR